MTEHLDITFYAEQPLLGHGQQTLPRKKIADDGLRMAAGYEPARPEWFDGEAGFLIVNSRHKSEDCHYEVAAATEESAFSRLGRTAAPSVASAPS